jgi:hypothetical protein
MSRSDDGKGETMKYALLIYGDESEFDTPAAIAEIQARHGAFAEELGEAMVGGEELQDVATATTVRHNGTAATVHDGPFAEAREQLGGFYLIEAENLDAAIAWARKLPMGRSGAVEIRPLAAM